ncbi:Cro/CI family transcriptional regulator [Comamonas terrae]|uniref:Cro/CI family transcriptional regulator n=1 Tax=Comamonas terrae TaxID=673548 RepID=A0ABW5URB1_9BURK|nr:Cro/CI family transcriptional regulator [Comamonas terrae]
MKKTDAIQLLGGSVAKAAEAIGINSQAISQWPDVLPPRISDRVQAALWRMSQKSAVVQTPELGTEVSHG